LPERTATSAATMTWVLYVVLGLFTTWALYLLYIHLAARAAEGRPADDLRGIFPTLDESPEAALVYCYSPACGPCRAMTVEVEALQQESDRVYKLDISEHFDLARQLGIRATPTVLLLRHGRIERSLVGAKRRDFLRKLLR
jgi:thioredoxin 1